jgi:hypothetical protein
MDSEPSVLGELKAGARSNLWPLLILAAMALLFFARFLRTDTIFLMRDLFQKHYPLHIYSSEILRHGALPLWNPYTGCGEPFLANIEGAVLYPPNLLYLVLPVTLATAALVIFHTWLTAAGGYALCRVWRVSRLGSLLAATMLSFNTYWLTRIEFLPSHATMAWFPAVLLLYALWARSRRARWIALAGLALGMQMLAGHPESVLFPLGAIALYAVMLGLWEARERKRWGALFPPVAAFAVLCALAILLAMAQILPTWELVRASSVHSGVVDPEVSKASVNPGMLATLLMPFLYGVPGYVGRYWSWPQLSCFEYWCGSFYVGVVAMVVLVGALLMRIAAPSTERSAAKPERAQRKGAPARADRPPAWLRVRMPFLLALLAGSTLYAMGRYTPFFWACWRALPFLQKFRWPSKSMIGAVFALSVLAGLALDYLSETPERTGRDGRRLQRMLAQWWTFSLFVLGAAFVGACLADGGRVGRLVLEKYFNLASLQPYEVHRIPWTALGRDAAKLMLLALVAPVLVLLWSSRNRLRTAAGWLLVGLAYADLFVTGRTLVPAGSADLLVRRSTDVPAQGDLGLARIFKVEAPGQYTYGETDENVFRCAREGLVMSWPIADHVFAVNAEGNFKLAGVMNLSAYCEDPTKPLDLRFRLLRMSNTDRVVLYSNADRPPNCPSLLDHYASGSALEPARMEPITEALPRAYVVGGPWMPAAGRSPFDGIAHGDFSFREAALVERSGPWANEFSDLRPGSVQQKVTRVAYGADLNSLAIDLWSGREALLVVTDAWYPGWSATVNGRAAPVAEVNAFQRGVRVPAGYSTVVMRYEPWTVPVGILVSLAALIAIVAWLVHNRSRPTSPTNASHDAQARRK